MTLDGVVSTADDPGTTDSSGARVNPWLGKRLPSPDYRIPIFFSYSSPRTEEQFDLAEGMYRLLMRRGLMPRTLGVNEYDLKAPLEGIRRIMCSSQGLLAIAFARTKVEKGSTSLRPGRDERTKEETLKNTFFSSPWVQIEAAMAYQWRLPILVLVQKGVWADGILEKGVVSSWMPEFDLDGGGAKSFLASRELREVMKKWENEVHARADRVPQNPY